MPPECGATPPCNACREDSHDAVPVWAPIAAHAVSELRSQGFTKHITRVNLWDKENLNTEGKMQKRSLHLWRYLKAAFRLACSCDFARLVYLVKMKFRKIDLDGQSLEELGLSSDRSVWYYNSGGPSLEKILTSSGITSSDAIIDFGCGKGGAMISMAKFPFARITGVEISAELVRVARDNFAKLGLTTLEVECSDAAAFKELDDYTVGYFYNPFPKNVMQEVLDNIRGSLLRRPRNFTIICTLPHHHELVLADVTPSFKKVGESQNVGNPVYVFLHSV